MRRARTKAAMLQEMRAHAGVQDAYQDSDGWWLDLRAGWTNTADDRPGALHGFHEDSVRVLYSKFRGGVQPCTCGDCSAAKARQMQGQRGNDAAAVLEDTK